jgi:Thiamine pyrophosphate enzyme, C-terminal TPP binding domain
MMASLSGNLATMCPGVPYAMAAKFAFPDRVAIALVGDGAMQMLGNNELITISHYLAHTGYKGQQTDEPEDPQRTYNLYEPVAGDHGAHGRFDDRSRNFSPQLWTDVHRDGLTAFVVLGAVALATAALANKKNDR